MDKLEGIFIISVGDLKSILIDIQVIIGSQFQHIPLGRFFIRLHVFCEVVVLPCALKCLYKAIMELVSLLFSQSMSIQFRDVRRILCQVGDIASADVFLTVPCILLIRMSRHYFDAINHFLVGHVFIA